MPRRPTRSNNSNRPSQSKLNRRLNNLDSERYEDLEQLVLAEFLSYEIETVDEEAGIVRIVEKDELRRYGAGTSAESEADLLRQFMDRADGEDADESP